MTALEGGRAVRGLNLCGREGGKGQAQEFFVRKSWLYCHLPRSPWARRCCSPVAQALKFLLSFDHQISIEQHLISLGSSGTGEKAAWGQWHPMDLFKDVMRGRRNVRSELLRTWENSG